MKSLPLSLLLSISDENAEIVQAFLKPSGGFRPHAGEVTGVATDPSRLAKVLGFEVVALK
jgi:hypothetical protein